MQARMRGSIVPMLAFDVSLYYRLGSLSQAIQCSIIPTPLLKECPGVHCLLVCLFSQNSGNLNMTVSYPRMITPGLLTIFPCRDAYKVIGNSNL